MWILQLTNKKYFDSQRIQWINLPIFPISHIIIPVKNKHVFLQGFDSYLYLEEYYQFVNRKGKVLDTINVLAKYKQEVLQISYNVRKGHLFQTKNKWGNEFTPLIWNEKTQKWDKGKARPTNKNLWHLGVIDSPIAKII